MYFRLPGALWLFTTRTVLYQQKEVKLQLLMQQWKIRKVPVLFNSSGGQSMHNHVITNANDRNISYSTYSLSPRPLSLHVSFRGRHLCSVLTFDLCLHSQL